jgi:hypothetical protein
MKLRFAIIIVLAFSLSPLASAQDKSHEKWLQVEVSDTKGQPLKDACVTFVPREGEIVFRNADSRGRVRLKRPVAVRYRVVVKVEGYEAQKREVTIGENSETVAFRLQPRENR